MEPVCCGNIQVDHPVENWACGTTSQWSGQAGWAGVGGVCRGQLCVCVCVAEGVGVGGRELCDMRREIRSKAERVGYLIFPTTACVKSDR